MYTSNTGSIISSLGNRYPARAVSSLNTFKKWSLGHPNSGKDKTEPRGTTTAVALTEMRSEE
jgi:hypothetical protein